MSRLLKIRTMPTCVTVGSTIPLIRSIHELTLIFSLDFIIFRASSSSTSPVRVSSMTSMTRSARGNLRRDESFCMLMRPRNASSITMHPRSAYEMLSFQNER
jgi:hypothetical protein